MPVASRSGSRPRISATASAAASMRILNLTSGTSAGPKPRDAEMAALWVERNDAQNYVLLGDPAVRLRVEAMT